ncbi:hypothetical protein [Pelagicoccus sp. SDUM812005]|uniref:hypothetical protein n=1 Tax=Pelagicoccus sp. SDUM812005 TaxID=3041257 RepID=UPI00280CEDD0|nr:hypothetical protein [Pelagicoccus sp. SDUM812005]MDQ8183887.1 hypothetical protein [Pelagicoccus sp. SDUM812005]
MKYLLLMLVTFLSGCTVSVLPEETKSYFEKYDAVEVFDQISERYENYCGPALPEKTKGFGFRMLSYGGIGSNFRVFELLEVENGDGIIIQKKGFSNTTIERIDKVSAVRLKELKNNELKLDEIWNWELPDPNPNTDIIHDTLTFLIEVHDNGNRHLVIRSSASKDQLFWTLIEAISEIERRSEQGASHNERKRSS